MMNDDVVYCMVWFNMEAKGDHYVTYCTVNMGLVWCFCLLVLCCFVFIGDGRKLLGS